MPSVGKREKGRKIVIHIRVFTCVSICEAAGCCVINGSADSSIARAEGDAKWLSLALSGGG